METKPDFPGVNTYTTPTNGTFVIFRSAYEASDSLNGLHCVVRESRINPLVNYPGNMCVRIEFLETCIEMWVGGNEFEIDTKQTY